MPRLTRPATQSCPVDARSGIGYFLITWIAAAFASSIVLVAFQSPDDDVSIPALGASLVAGWVVFCAGVWLTSRTAGTSDAFSDFGIRVAPFDLVGVPIGLLTQFVVIPSVYIPLRAVWPDTFTDAALSETAEDLVDQASGGLLVVLILLVVVGAPIVEEIVYRGLLQRPLLGAFPAAIVIVGVAAIFALIHFRPVEYPGLFVAGLIFGGTAWWSGRLGTSIMTHLAFNAVGLALVV